MMWKKLLFAFTIISLWLGSESLCAQVTGPILFLDSMFISNEEVTDQEEIILEITNNLSEVNHVPDFIPDVDYDEVGDRLSCLQTEIPLNYNTQVRGFIEYFTVRNREYTKAMIARKNVYFPLFEKYLKEYGLPDELKYLSIVESGLEPKANSRVGAAGLWQFMPSTGRLYKLHQDWYIDERLDPEKATEAACKYLKWLYNYLGDWEMALAAYNSGPGNVRKAIRRSGYKRTFWEVYRYLPRETRSYVPQFVAVIYAMNYAEEHNLNVEGKYYAWQTDTIQVNQYVNLETLANLTEVCLDDLMKLNPELKRSAVPGYAKDYALRLPVDIVPIINAQRNFMLDSAAKKGEKELEFIAKNSIGSTYNRQKIYHRVRRGDVIGKIAERYKVRIADIRTWNNLRSNTIRLDQKLAIWVRKGSVNQSVTPVIAKKTTPPQPPIDLKNAKVLYTVQEGDTLWDISRKYKNLSIDKIKKLNNLKSNKIKPGQKLVLG